MEKTVKAVFDSNVLIDYLLGEKKAKQEFDLYEQIHVSIITWIEVVVGAKNETEEQQLKLFFQEFIARIYEFIGGYIEQRQRDGAFREMNPRIAVRAFLGMLIHHSLNNILWDKGRTILDISTEEAAKNFAEILLNGIKSWKQ